MLCGNPTNNFISVGQYARIKVYCRAGATLNSTIFQPSLSLISDKHASYWVKTTNWFECRSVRLIRKQVYIFDEFDVAGANNIQFYFRYDSDIDCHHALRSQAAFGGICFQERSIQTIFIQLGMSIVQLATVNNCYLFIEHTPSVQYTLI